MRIELFDEGEPRGVAPKRVFVAYADPPPIIQNYQLDKGFDVVPGNIRFVNQRTEVSQQREGVRACAWRDRARARGGKKERTRGQESERARESARERERERGKTFN